MTCEMQWLKSLSGMLTKMIEPSPTHPMVPEVQKANVNRGITANGNMGLHRGDRRDMSKLYTNNKRHAAHANNPRPDVSTRAR